MARGWRREMMAGGHMGNGGRYELEDLLGRGGMAEVRRAVDTRLGRPVAIKQLRTDLATDPTFQARFRREAQSAAGLNHPNIVAVYDTGEETDPRTGTSIPYIVMELVEGPTLRDVLRDGRKILPERPGAERVDARRAISAPGCVMYERVVGRPPFVGDSPVSVAYQHVRETPVPPSQLDPVITPDIDTVTLKALAKDPADRYQSAREMKADITRVLAGQQATAVVPRVGEDATAATPTQVVPPATMVAPVAAAGPPLDLDEEEERKPRVGLAIAITAAIILVLGLGAFALYSILTPEQPTVQTVAVPNVLNFPQKLAVEQLEGHELKVSIKKENGKDDETKGTVTAQNPVPDTAVEPGSTVTITVNVGPETGKIPKNLVGKDKDDVQEALEDAGFTNVDLKEAEEEDPDTEPDEVISVSPKEGATAAKSGKVTVTYATGKSPVPDFTGLSEQRARDDARAAGFDSVEVVEEETNEQPVGTVIRQNPKPGDVAERTFKIRLVVAQAVPEPTPTPTPPSTPPTSPSPTPSATPS